VAIRYNVIDHPDGKLKTHREPVAYLGGLAIFTGFVITLAIFFPNTKEVSMLFPLALLLLLGLFDDLFPLSPLLKFAGQIVASIVFVRIGYQIPLYFLPTYLNQALSLLWFLTIINAFNLIDIMDGLAVSLGIATITSFLVFSIMLHQHALALFLVIILGCLCAFIYYNRDPATIYLGDAGSLFLGGYIAACPFLIDWTIISPVGIVAPIIILMIPLLEISQLIVIRTIKKIPFYRGSKDHFALYLLRNGWTKIAIVDYVCVIAILLFFIAKWLVFDEVSLYSIFLLFVLFLIIWFFFLIKKLV